MENEPRRTRSIPVAIAGWLCAGAFTVVVLPFGATAKPDEPASPTCVRYWGEARYVIGYDQLVHVDNGCDRRATCLVSSNRNRVPRSITLAPGEHGVVTTYLGAASSSFVPIVACRLDDDG